MTQSNHGSRRHSAVVCWHRHCQRLLLHQSHHSSIWRSRGAHNPYPFRAMMRREMMMRVRLDAVMIDRAGWRGDGDGRDSRDGDSRDGDGDRVRWYGGGVHPIGHDARPVYGRLVSDVRSRKGWTPIEGGCLVLIVWRATRVKVRGFEMRKCKRTNKRQAI
jgi:hypothetical protein